MNRECSSIERLLDKYFDQETSQKEKAIVEAHLSDCPACRTVLERMENLRILIRGPVEEAVEKETFPWVWEKIERGIQRQEKRSLWESMRSWLGLPLWRRRVLIPALAVAVMAFLLVAPWLFKKTPSHPIPSVVEYVASETHNVMVYETMDQKVTVIWLFNGIGEETSSS